MSFFAFLTFVYKILAFATTVQLLIWHCCVCVFEKADSFLSFFKFMNGCLLWSDAFLISIHTIIWFSLVCWFWLLSLQLCSIASDPDQCYLELRPSPTPSLLNYVHWKLVMLINYLFSAGPSLSSIILNICVFQISRLCIVVASMY